MYQKRRIRISNTVQHLATPCNTLQHPATPCNMLQHADSYIHIHTSKTEKSSVDDVCVCTEPPCYTLTYTYTHYIWNTLTYVYTHIATYMARIATYICQCVPVNTLKRVLLMMCVCVVNHPTTH